MNLVLLLQDFLERADVCFEGAFPLGGRGDEGFRFAGDKGFIDGNVAGLFERLEVRAKVAVGEGDGGSGDGLT